VTAKQGFSVKLEVFLRRLQETIYPRQQFLGAVIGMQNDGYTVLFRHGSDMESTRHGTGNGRSVIGIVQTLSGIEREPPDEN
jgi:hypothetical protein